MKLAKPRVSSHFSELTDPSYVSSSMCPGYPAIKFGRPGYSLHPLESGADFVQGPGAMTTSPTSLVPSRCGASRTIWDCSWPWSISSPPMAAAPATLPKGKPGTWMNEWARKPTLNLSIYEIVFSLFAKSECRSIQIILCMFGRKLAFCKNQLKVSDIEGKMVLTS